MSAARTTVLLVDDHQRQPRQGGQHRHARAQHDARGAGVRGQPGGQPLRRRQAAVQRSDLGGAEPGLEARQQLRCPLALENLEDEDPRTGRHPIRSMAHITLSLPTETGPSKRCLG